ncbi:MAG TPA: alanine racemase [Chloroflexia bacterium]|jgi:alanine racemase
MQIVRDNPVEAQEDRDAASWGRPIRAEIDLSAIASNVRALRKLIGPRCRVMAVVKANGYGLGAPWVAAAAIEGGASMLAVACVDEGVELRRAGYSGPILVMSYVPPDEAEAAVRNGLTLVLHRLRTALALDEAARQQGLEQGQVAVHIKVDTGLGRYGCLPGEFLPLVQGILRLEHLRLEGLMTHFADADAEDLSFTREQLARFNWVRRQAEEHGIQFDIIHAANTAAALALPESRFDMVRAGIMLSGHLPAPHLQGTVRLQPALTLRTRLARVFRVGEGETVGYGRTWVARRPSVVGLVPVGYADGYPRELSNRGQALVRGTRCSVAGRVSMDQIGVDLTDVAGVAEGDEVVLIGRQGNQEITADEIAGWCNTISYEILCGLSDRVPRHYIHDGQPIEVCNLLGCSPTRERKRPRKELSR